MKNRENLFCWKMNFHDGIFQVSSLMRAYEAKKSSVDNHQAFREDD
jgi:hypothetical protein